MFVEKKFSNFMIQMHCIFKEMIERTATFGGGSGGGDGGSEHNNFNEICALFTCAPCFRCIVEITQRKWVETKTKPNQHELNTNETATTKNWYE